MFADGQDTREILGYFRGLGSNIVRMWPYVPWGWDAPSNDDILAFIRFARTQGYRTYLTLLTDDNPARIPWAQELVRFLAHQQLDCLLLEIGNEPDINKHINTAALKEVCSQSGYLYTSGEYDDSSKWFGHFVDGHTPRDNEWCRKSHDLHEYYIGAGPTTTWLHPAMAPFAGEPIRPDQAPDGNGIDKTADYEAYAGGCAIMGSGAFFHYDGSKYGTMPNDDDRRCAERFFHGLNYFPHDAPLAGPYERIDEHGETLRTYKVGPYVVRVRPKSGPILQGA